MKIECVIVSLNYSDFLSHTLPHNKNFFNRMVVVTDTKDIETKRVCEFFNVECVQTDAFYLDSDVPNKSRGINAGLERLDLDGWVLQLDADIYLLPQTRNILESFILDEKKLYGIDRLMCNSYEEWMHFIHKSKPIYEGWIYCHLDRFPVGTRIIQYNSGFGYMPIGYFQLWNPGGCGIYDYPIENAGFDRTDVVHLKRWDKSNIGFIPDLVCIHLASESHKQGQNWQGRKTSKFGPTIHSKAGIFSRICDWFKNLINRIIYRICVFFGCIKTYLCFLH